MSNLRKLRESEGLSRETLARLAETSTSTITRMELLGHVPSAATAARIASVLDSTVENILPLEQAS